MEGFKDIETITAEEVLGNLNKEIVFFSKYEQNQELKCCSFNKGYITQSGSAPILDLLKKRLIKSANESKFAAAEVNNIFKC